MFLFANKRLQNFKTFLRNNFLQHDQELVACYIVLTTQGIISYLVLGWIHEFPPKIQNLQSFTTTSGYYDENSEKRNKILVRFPTDMNLDVRSKWVGEPDYKLVVLSCLRVALVTVRRAGRQFPCDCTVPTCECTLPTCQASIWHHSCTERQ